jgi:transposase-like protein
MARLFVSFPTCTSIGAVFNRSCGGKSRSVSVLIAIGVGADGFRQILVLPEAKEIGRVFLQ